MSDISKMNDKQLRNEVQLLRDELAIMKRKYEDIIYNLDTDNFSSRFVKEQGDMKTAIKVTAEGIETKVSNEEFESTKKQTAELISSEVKKLSDADDELSTKITQTATDIRAEVKKVEEETKNGIEKTLVSYTTIEMTEEKINLSASQTKTYVTNLLEETYVTKSDFVVAAEEIRSTVQQNYATKGYVSEISQTADEISLRVSKVEEGKFGQDASGEPYTLFTQNAERFTFQGNYMDIQSAIRLTDNDGNHAFSIFHQQSDGNVYMWGMGDYEYTPLVIGNKSSSQTQGVYLYDDIDDNLIATQGWVLDHAGSGGTVVARFG